MGFFLSSERPGVSPDLRKSITDRGVESRYSTVFVTSGYPQSKYSLLSIRSSVIVTSINEVSSVQGSRYCSACGQG